MSYVAPKGDKDYDGAPAAKSHKIRITLTSKNVKNLEKGACDALCGLADVSVCTDLVNRSKDKDLRVKGPVRLPTKCLTITTRKTVRCRCCCLMSDAISPAVRAPRPGTATSSRSTSA